MKKQTIVLFIIGTVLITSCQKHFLDVNTNPNNPTSADPALVFTNALSQTASIVTSDYGGLFFPENYVSLSTEYQVAFNITRNNYTSSDFTNGWYDNYHNLEDYDFIEQTAQAEGKNFLVAAAKTMKALGFQMLVDTYNDVPYTQALQLSNNISTPSYDKGQAIYGALILKLDSAISIFENSASLSSYNPGSADVMFGGNATLWAQFANTLKLRLLLHEINVSSQSSFIQSEAAKIAADPVGCLGAGTSASVNPGYTNDASSHLSPLWANFGYNINGGYANSDESANSYFISKLSSFNDTRLGYFYGTNGSGQIQGNPFGIPSNAVASFLGGTVNKSNSNNLPYAYSGSSYPSTWGILQNYSQSAIILSSWESLFLQAEATLRGLLPGGSAAAGALYNQAITDNFTYLNVFTDGNTYDGNPADWAAAYYSQNIPNVGWAASSSNYLQAIIVQKYISLCLTDVLEAWTDFRRTGYPADLPVSNDPAKVYNYIYRFIYPQGEYNTNATQVNKEGTITPVSPKIFWMP